MLSDEKHNQQRDKRSMSIMSYSVDEADICNVMLLPILPLLFWLQILFDENRK